MREKKVYKGNQEWSQGQHSHGQCVCVFLYFFFKVYNSVCMSVTIVLLVFKIKNYVHNLVVFVSLICLSFYTKKNEDFTKNSDF